MKLHSIRHVLQAMSHVFILRPLMRLLCGVHFVGRENLRSLDRFIIIGNHNSHLDVALLFCLLSPRDISRTHVVAEETYFARSKVVFHMVNFLFQPVWIKRGTASRQDNVLDGCIKAIKQGSNLVIFPEGTRGKPGEIQAFKSGVGRLIAQFKDIPILPVFLSGPERVLPKNCFIPLPFWNQIVIGPPQICNGKHHDVTQHLQNVLGGLSKMPHLRRHGKTRLLRKPAYTVALIGIDGSGKSSISHKVAIELSNQGRAYLVSDQLECYENAESNPLQPYGLDAIRQMLSRHAKRATSLKGYKLPKLTELLMRDYLIKEVERWYDASIVVQDGSPLLNMAGWAALYPDLESLDSMLIDGIAVLAGKSPEVHNLSSVCSHFSEINILSRLGLNRLKIPDAYVLLDISPEVACDRIQQRGKRLQPHENIEKLTRLRQAYLRVERLISQRWNVPSLVLDGNTDIKDISKTALQFFHKHFEIHRNGNV